ncbi:MAG: Gfo/Idh/MocA family oxidoreductase, partial [Planctomycetales bacterium]|nr:Gfo/Idh/MocA family oxidoreductase [Planctomycetales bacterium]
MSPLTRRHFVHSAAALAVPMVFTGVASAADPQRKLRVAQIGVGHAHATKLSVYRESNDYEVVGVAEADATRRAAAENHAAFRDLPWLTAEQILNDESIEIVLVETTVDDLLTTAEQCIAANKH